MIAKKLLFSFYLLFSHLKFEILLCGVIWGHFRRFQALRGQMDFRQYTALCIFILYIA